MSDIRENLIDWLLHSGCDPEACESCEYRENNIFSCLRKDAGVKADRLIANGVTVQKWIPVSERLPEPLTDVLSYRGHRNLIQEDCVDEKGRWYSEYKYSGANVTHWMPMPEPPKEGE